jgi:hypothetical protein
MKTLCAAPAKSASCYLKIVYIQNGKSVTALSKLVTIGIGVLLPASVPVPGLTPLYAEVAAQMFFPLQPKAGLPLYFESPNGKVFALVAIDNADATATPQITPVN